MEDWLELDLNDGEFSKNNFDDSFSDILVAQKHFKRVKKFWQF